MGRLRVPAAQPVSDYDDAGDWFRGAHCLLYAHHTGVVDDSCAEVANYLDAWEAANSGPPRRLDGERMSSWPAFCGGRERFSWPGASGERKLSAVAVREGWYDPIEYMDL
ncbi:hypothetical protein [Mycobacterium avium]|uniref:hypothetical protein n=1 Tax=Mycobacterium avium TaxID=1764 RepID=UPI0007A0578F|nr:hypothetical protein [Mycobacterium avium]MBZ4508578.1 hypothetical protein [Mycobacterium avium subsp. hominissuis]MBZ4516307.1 hypothetical protein [Mycobacterium avium subsp. hominissuis]MBZ4545848.1 hypothetical protein [Mycobacterium avium subsp. hominissuis]MBZ4554334.1 hypothetical protein [Mycobacterium avium subsp. hominissuis]MBZ4564219.1 hypothetical protein [Mycobacterium avium subsp. hominissuis]